VEWDVGPPWRVTIKGGSVPDGARKSGLLGGRKKQ